MSENDNQNKRINIYVSNDLYVKLKDIKRNYSFSTVSEFIREAIRDKINSLENPNMVSSKDFMDSEVLREIMDLKNKVNGLDKNTKETQLKINGNMKELSKKLENDQITLSKQIVSNILKEHISLEVEEITNLSSSLTENKVILALSYLVKDGLVKLNKTKYTWVGDSNE